MCGDKVAFLLAGMVAASAGAQTPGPAAGGGAATLAASYPITQVTIGDLARAQAKAIEGEMAELLLRAKGVAAPQPAAVATPAQQAPGQAASKGEKPQESRVARAAGPVVPKRTHITFLGLYGEEGSMSLEFEMPDGEIVTRRAGGQIGQHRVEVAPSGRVTLVGKSVRQIRPGDNFN